MARRLKLTRKHRNSAPAIVTAIAVAGCGADVHEPPATSEATAAATISANDCGPGSSSWPFDPESASWRQAVPDAPPPAGYSVPAVQLAGRIEGEASASQGVASYRVPIVVAPGRAGMTPELVLRYASSSPNDVAGVGWTMSGASRIHRCPRTQAQDGEVLPVSYSSTDRLCLDGERLVLSAGTYGRANAEYRTELDSFARIKQTGSLDAASTCFVAEHKDGSVSVYGGCEDPGAAHLLPGATKPWAWAVRRIADARGNDMRFEYDVEDGQHLLRRIRYTGHTSAGQGDRRVELAYERREDVDIDYIAQFQLRSVRRLASITSYAAAGLVRRYELDYVTSRATRRSLLHRVRTCASATCTAATSLPATTFTYGQAPAAFDPEEIPSSDPERERIHLVADYDGDGRRDRVRLTYPEAWGGSPRSRVLELSGGATVDLGGSPWTAAFDRDIEGVPGMRDVDFDNDGRADLMGTINGTFAIGSWNPVTQQIDIKTSNRTITGTIHEAIDLNADGTMDLLVTQNHQYTAHFQCPTSPPGQLQFCGPAQLLATVASCEQVARVADYDGNGIPDLFVTDNPELSPCAGDPKIIFLRRNGGVGLASSTQTVIAMGGPAGQLLGGRFRQIDVTGDGLLDIVGLPASSVYINEGGSHQGLPQTRFRRASLTVAAPITLTQRLIDAMFEADIDQDGRAELLYPKTIAGNWCYLSANNQTEKLDYCSDGRAGGGDFDQAPPGTDYTVYRWNALEFELDAAGDLIVIDRPTNLEAPIKRRRAEDHNGDGLVDVAYTLAPLYGEVQAGTVMLGSYDRPSGHHVARHRGPAPDLLVSAVDGIGGTATFQYAALSTSGVSRCASQTQPFYRANYTSFVPDGIHSLSTSSRHVVARMEVSNGAGGRNGTCFRYEDAWMHRLGRGFLAFGKTIEEEDVPGDRPHDLRTTRLHHRDWPLTGRVFEEKTDLASDPVSAAPLTKTTTTWASTCTGARCFVYPDARTVETRDLATRALLGTRATDYVWNPADLAYGNLSEERLLVSDALHSQATRTQLFYDYTDAASWWLDRLVRKVQTFEGIVAPPASPGPTHVVTTTYDHYTSGNGRRLVSWERVQPSDPTQARSTLTVYDKHGNPIGLRTEAANAATRFASIKYTPDGYFAANTTNPQGHVTQHTIDARFGLPTSTVDPNGLVTSYQYDPFGRRTQVDGPASPPADERLLSCANGGCPPRAVLRAVTMQPGAPTMTRYLDVLGRAVRESTTAFGGFGEAHVMIEYDARGREIAKSTPTYDVNKAYYTRYLDFDALGRHGRKTIDRASGNPISIAYRYDGLDTVIRLPGVANELVRTYDSQRRLVRSRDAAGFTTRYEYDASGQLSALVDPSGNTIHARYDALGRRLSLSHPDGGTRTTTYDGFGLARTEIDARGQRVELTYDALGRPRTRTTGTFTVQQDAEWGYDRTLKGALDYERGGSEGLQGYCRGFAYDKVGRLEQAVTFADGLALSTEYAHDAYYGRVKGMRYPSGRAIALGYDSTGRQRSEQHPISGLRYREITAMWPDGQVRSERFGNGLVGDYFVDPASLATDRLWVHWPNTEVQRPSVQDLRYDYDHPFAILSKQRNALTLVEEAFTYDELHRLRTATRTWPGGTTTRIDHQYDALGNLVVKSDYSALTSYGSAGRANPANAGPHAIRAFRRANGTVVSDFRYDGNGNLVAGDGRTATYDAFDKPLTITHAGVRVGFAYAPSLERYRRVTKAGKTYYVDKLYEHIVDQTGTTHRDYVGKVVLTTLPNGTEQVRYLHPDRLGSTDTLSDDTGKPVEWHGYEPFGGPRDSQWRSVAKLHGGSTDRGFTGHEHIDDVGIIHMNGRVYDPRLGRFLSVDPFVVEPADGQTLNAYSYTRNNPVMRIDPTGYSDVDPPPAADDRKVVKVEKVKVHVKTTGSHITPKVDALKASFADGSSVTITKGQDIGKLADVKVQADPGAPGKSWSAVEATTFKAQGAVKADPIKVKSNGKEHTVEASTGLVTAGTTIKENGNVAMRAEIGPRQKFGESVEAKAVVGGEFEVDPDRRDFSIGRVSVYVKVRAAVTNAVERALSLELQLKTTLADWRVKLRGASDGLVIHRERLEEASGMKTEYYTPD
jgi:RHS repeat-associated protein